MKNRFIVSFSLALALGLAVIGLQGGASHGQTASQRAGQPAIELVMFEQYACEWCEIWNEQVGVVYHKTKEGRRAPLRRVDIHSARPGDLTALSPIIYTPTFVLMQQGVEIGRIKGYPGEGFFWGMLEELMKRLARDNGSRT